MEDQLKALDRYRIDPSRLTISNDSVLYSDRHGTVRTAILLNEDVADSTEHTTVSIKIFRRRPSRLGEAQLTRLTQTFLQEVVIWSQLDFPTVQKLIGFDIDDSWKEPRLICSYLPRGKLVSHLQEHPGSRETLLRWVLDITEAVDYLHSRLPPVVHGDLKAANVLLSDSGRATVTGFEAVSLEGDESGPISADELQGSTRWCSPELLTGGRHTTLSDVWAWACLALEIMTSKIPYHTLAHEALVTNHINMGRMINSDDYPELPAADPIWNILRPCWQMEPTTRPNINICLTNVRNTLSSTRPESSTLLPLIRLQSTSSDSPANELRLVRRLRSSNGRVSDSFKAIVDTTSTGLLAIKFIGVTKDPATWIRNYEQTILLRLPNSGDTQYYLSPRLTVGNERICAISPWQPQGNIWDFVNSHVEVNSHALILHIITGLGFLHERGIIHSGVKVDNVLITADGRPVLNDVGLTKFMEESFPREDVVGPIDQVRWAAPEIVDGDPYTTASDIYSLALLMLALEARQLPFWQYDKYGTLSRVRAQNPSPVIADFPQMTTEHGLWELLEDCWAVEVYLRPAAADIRQRYSDLPIRQRETAVPVSNTSDVTTSSMTIDPVVGAATSWDEFVTRIVALDLPYRVSLDVEETSGPDSTPQYQWTATILFGAHSHTGRGLSEVDARERAASLALAQVSGVAHEDFQ